MSKEKKAAAAAAAKVERFKKRLKRTICVLIIMFIMGLVFLTVGILFLVFFGKHWSDNTTVKRVFAYAGLVMLVLGLILAAIGIVVCIILYRVYRRATSHSQPPMFKPPSYAPGQAPYPQQPPAPDPASMPLSGTTMTGPDSTTNPADVHQIDITPHEKF